MTSICLNMIVKNEVHVLPQLFASLSHLIQYWVIVDTGSHDGTQEFVRKYFSDKRIPGELIERPWKDFGSNRTEALELADGKADYLWVIDADDEIYGKLSFNKLTLDCYQLKYGKDFIYWRKQLFKSGLNWKYIGVLHEYPHSDVTNQTARLEGNYYIESRRLGARSQDPKKYLKDAQILEKALQENPANSRYWFYLGQSYFDAGDFEKSRTAYLKRSEMSGWAEEVFYSLYRVGMCSLKLGAEEAQIVQEFLKAYSFHPTRAEPIYEIAKYYREKGNYALGYLFAKMATLIPLPKKDLLFIFHDVYDYKALDELSICAYYAGHLTEGLHTCKMLLKKNLPESEHERVEKNMTYFLTNVEKKVSNRAE